MNTENQKADNIKSGYIYILYNEVYTYYGENVFKIGKSNNIEQRLTGYTTSYIKPCEIKYLSTKCINYSLAESVIFELLSKNRIVCNREFFKIDKTEAVNIIDDIIYKINNGIPIISKKQKNDKTEKEPIKITKLEIIKQIETEYNINVYEPITNNNEEDTEFNDNLFKSIVKLFGKNSFKFKVIFSPKIPKVDLEPHKLKNAMIATPNIITLHILEVFTHIVLFIKLFIT